MVFKKGQYQFSIIKMSISLAVKGLIDNQHYKKKIFMHILSITIARFMFD